MRLEKGTALGSYEILGPIGAGGMGEVYRARDTHLEREVAIKVLPKAVASDAARLERFAREAKALAALNHPTIATIHGFETARPSGDRAPIPFLVMELVEGPTLAERIAEGPIPLAEALPIFAQIAQGLATAHHHGIVHRDLKPANIKIVSERETPSGDQAPSSRSSVVRTKILDFGLAKDLHQALDHDHSLSRSPTLTMAATARGEVLGTAFYMSPEQAQGDKIDHRTDIWAFGCVLYEALTGERAFPGDTFPRVLGSILSREPDAAALERLDRRVANLVRRCLQKDAANRPQDMRAVEEELLDLQESLRQRTPRLLRLPALSTKRLRVALATGILVAVAVAGWWLLPAAPREGPAQADQPLTLAVLPFDDLLQDAASERLEHALNAGLITRLSRIRGVRVVGHRDSSQSQPRSGVLLGGALERDAGGLVARIRLTDGPSGVVLLSERFESASDTTAHLENQIVEELTRYLSLSASRREQLRSDPSRSLEAYRFYSRGIRLLDRWYEPREKTAVETALENLRQAVRLDPSFAEAQAGLGRALATYYSFDPDADLLVQAEAAIEAALDIDPDLPAAHVARIRLQLLRGEFQASVEELENLLRGHPKPDEAYRTVAQGFHQAGDLERAKQIAQAAIALADDDWRNWNYLGQLHLDSGEFEEASTALTRAAELAPPDVMTPRGNLFALELYQGRFREGIDLIADVEPSRMEAGMASNLATAYFFLEEYDNSERFYRLALELEPNRPLLHSNLGDLLERTDQHEQARSEYLEARRLTDQFLASSPQDQSFLISRATYSAKAGDCSDALPRARALQETWNPTGADEQQIAHTFALCNRPQEAIVAIRRALELGISAEILAIEDEFSSLRERADFIALVGTDSSL